MSEFFCPITEEVCAATDCQRVNDALAGGVDTIRDQVIGGIRLNVAQKELYDNVNIWGDHLDVELYPQVTPEDEVRICPVAVFQGSLGENLGPVAREGLHAYLLQVVEDTTRKLNQDRALTQPNKNVDAS